MRNFMKVSVLDFGNLEEVEETTALVELSCSDGKFANQEDYLNLFDLLNKLVERYGNNLRMKSFRRPIGVKLLANFKVSPVSVMPDDILIAIQQQLSNYGYALRSHSRSFINVGEDVEYFDNYCFETDFEEAVVARVINTTVD